jgi:dTMP kinase
MYRSFKEMTENGIFIVLEGVDGSGKSTQFRLLSERLKAVGYDVEVFKFPQYDQSSSHFIKKYLNGDYGNASEISPYTASLFYALDRYEASPRIKDALHKGKIVLSDRYVGSNMAHQGGKFTNSGEQRGFFIWEDGLEFQMLGIPSRHRTS